MSSLTLPYGSLSWLPLVLHCHNSNTWLGVAYTRFTIGSFASEVNISKTPLHFNTRSQCLWWLGLLAISRSINIGFFLDCIRDGSWLLPVYTLFHVARSFLIRARPPAFLFGMRQYKSSLAEFQQHATTKRTILLIFSQQYIVPHVEEHSTEAHSKYEVFTIASYLIIIPGSR